VEVRGDPQAVGAEPFLDRGAGSLLPDDAEDRTPVYSTAVLYYAPRESIVFDRFKYIRDIESDAHELYDFALDPSEQNDIAGANANIVKRAQELLEAHSDVSALLREIYDTQEAPRFNLDPETIKRMKALGYL
jgi:hypothetical protein